MTDTIRDVVIRIALQQLESAIKTPDLSGLIQAQKQAGQAAQEANLQLKAESHALDNLKLKAEDSNAVWLEQIRLKDETDRAVESLKTEANALRETAGAAEHAGAAHEGHAHHLSQAARPLNALIGGVHHLAHATIELSAANEEDAEQMVRKFMQYNAYFSLATGGIHVIHGLSHAHEIFAAASWKAAAAQTALVAPVALLIAAVGSGIYVLHEFYDVFGIKAREAREETEKHEKALEDLIHQMEKSRLHETTEIVRARYTVEGKEDEIRNLEQKMSIEQRLARIAEERVNAEQNLIAARGRAGEHSAEEERVSVERIVDLRKREVEALNEARRALEDEVRMQETIARNADKALEAEQERNKSVAARIGMLNDAEREELKLLSEKIKAGTATDADYKRAEQLGGDIVGDVTKKHFADKGEADADTIFQNIHGYSRKQDEDIAGNQADNAYQQQIRAEQKQREELPKLQEELKEAINAANEAIRELLKVLIGEANENRKEVERAAQHRKAAHGG